jgi:HAE1 family hydrophobic/amphiphilic exporter-1
MNITELSVRRPTAIIMVMALFVGLGIVGYLSLGADLFPSVNTPVISVHAAYLGAGAEEINKDIIKPIEDAVSGVNGIERTRSVSVEGFGYTIIQFTMSTDMDAAVIDVQKALDGIAATLPKDATRPVMQKFDVNAQPILILSVSGSAAREELYTWADEIKRSLESLRGIGNVSVQGEDEKQLTITVDKNALESYGVSTTVLLGSLQAANLTVPAGEIRQKDRDLTVRLLGEFRDLTDVRSLRVPLLAGGSVPLGEIAAVELGYPEPLKMIRRDAKPSIGIFVRKQSDANVVETANRVKAALAEAQKSLPPGVEVAVASDATTFINSSLDETRLNLVESILTTALVLFLFLRRWRSSLIVLVAIPTSLIATFFMMYIFHFTLNIVSLMALGVCIGILVDDSIVILENVHRHIQLGEDPHTAAVRGRMEIGLAAVAITLCDVVVFAPVAFMSDIVGQFFKQFGLTVVFSTLFSLFVSFTVTPMMASRLLGKERGAAPGEEPAPQGRFGRFFDRVIKGGYRGVLEWALANRWKVILGIAALIAASIALIPMKAIETEFMPSFDQSKLVVDIDLGAGATIHQTDQKSMLIERHLRELPEVADTFATIGSDTAGVSAAEIIVRLKDKGQRRKSQSTLARELREWGKKVPGVDFSVTEQSIIARTSIEGSKAFILNVSGPNRDVLRDLSYSVEGAIRSVRGVVDVDNTMRSSRSEVSVRIDRLAAADYGLTTYDIAGVLRTALAGTKVGVYRHGGDEYDIVVRYREDQVKTPLDLGTLRITNPLGQQITLDKVASFLRAGSPQEILTRDRQNVATISANLQGRPLGSVTAEVREKLSPLRMPFGYGISYGGDTQNMATAFRSLALALVASVLLVYMILIVLYESFLTPVIRMLALPVGIIGAFAGLALTGKAINIITFIGLIMLDGLVSKNGTLLIDYTNTLMKRGLPLREALLEAGVTRLRPIIMTSVTMIVGMLPLALSLGASSEIRSGMATVLIGGLVTSTILSPVLLPVVYTLVQDARSARSRRKSGAIPHGGYRK